MAEAGVAVVAEASLTQGSAYEFTLWLSRKPRQDKQYFHIGQIKLLEPVDELTQPMKIVHSQR